MQYYLPALMHFTARTLDEPMWLHDSLAFTFIPESGSSDLAAYQRTRFSLLSQPQRAAIAAFVAAWSALDRFAIEPWVATAWAIASEAPDDEWLAEFQS